MADTTKMTKQEFEEWRRAVHRIYGEVLKEGDVITIPPLPIDKRPIYIIKKEPLPQGG